MRSKAMTAAVVVAIAGAVAVAGSAIGRAEGTTKVTIKAGGEVYGYVKSSKPGKCADGRKVVVFQQKGGSQGGGDDIKKGSDTASPNGDKYQWSIGNPGLTGKKIYAKAKRKQGCAKDSSKTVVAG